MNKAILFRVSQENEEEYNELCKTKWICHSRLLHTLPGELIIGRYSVLPFYKDVEAELEIINCKLINSYQQHRYIADIENWYNDLSTYTPKTWFEWSNLPDNKSFVVKGRTNSRKFQWNTQMFCKTKADVIPTISSLYQDSLIRDQGFCVREYVPLKQYDIGINGLPITNEWRVFCYKSEVLIGGYYWSNYPECQPYNWEQLPSAAKALLNSVVSIVGQNTNFYVVDIAETASGDWIVIELNDGQMSGLSEVNPTQLYNKLYDIIKE